MSDTTTADSEPCRPLGLPLNDQLGLLARLQSLKVLLGTDSPEVRGWAPVVQQGAQATVNAAIAEIRSAADRVAEERERWQKWACRKEWDTVNDPPCHPGDKDWRPCANCAGPNVNVQPNTTAAQT